MSAPAGHLVAYALGMHRDPDELFCPTCTSYAHPFLDACPVCGMARTSLYEAATAAPDQGLASLPSNPRVAQDVSEVVLRYFIKLNSASPTANLREGLVSVADALSYRVSVGGDPGAGANHGHVEIGAANLVIRERNPARERVRFPLEAILAISPAVKGRRTDTWAGLVFGELRTAAALPPLDGDLVIAHAAPGGVVRVALANRSGLFAPRARPDHYALLARWLGIVAAGMAEQRWMDVGPDRHAHELGLMAAPPEGGTGPVDDAPATGQPTVVEAMRLLEELRSAGLVSDDEYAAKRREILDRI